MSNQDARDRRYAVDPARSVIVQAPAGSGKTSLLVERYLALLGVVDAPEEILAITFTRKAAAEMRERVLQFLDPSFEPEKDHERSAHALAQKVASRVEEWGLRQNPQRLMIRTIDSFSHFLARSMPIASELGPEPLSTEQPTALYRAAARRVLAKLGKAETLAPNVKALLLWCDHQAASIEDLLVTMLARRDQWLPILFNPDNSDREHLQKGLSAVVADQMAILCADVEQQLVSSGTPIEDLLALLNGAADQLRMENPDSVGCQWPTLQALPEPTLDALPHWRALAYFLLSQKGEWRQKVNKTMGFPPKTDETKAMTDLLKQLAGNEKLAVALQQIRSLPDPVYSDDQWNVLAAMMEVLKSAASELELIFREQGKNDFIGLSAAAQKALGDADRGYTDLALYLDERIRHLLVDEYQDTNRSQFQLLEKLVASWQQDEQRSLFLVGDPMQSIYRFREAQVGLFMQARDAGIGEQTLESLQLTCNFRSRREIVDWVNHRLGPIFPKEEDIDAGAVAYAPSTPPKEKGGQIHVIAAPDPTSEAEALVSKINSILAENEDDPKFKAAVLVKTRSHLKALLPALDRHNVPYRAVKLDTLADRPVVQDLLALTRAVIDPDDSASVLAMLRSPACGLTLSDLHALVGNTRKLYDDDALSRLSQEGRQRAEKVYQVLEQAADLWQRRSIRELVEGAWYALGGSAIYPRPERDLAEANLYFDILEQCDRDSILPDWNAFMERLEKSYTEGDPDSTDIKLEVTTMHGAKGLEWDLVILPQLNRGSRAQGKELLNWLPMSTTTDDQWLLLAPLRSARQSENPPLVEFIRTEQKKREAYERQRLLYVACTRAKQHLVLSASLDPEKSDSVSKGSLLEELWPSMAHDFKKDLEARSSESVTVDDEHTDTMPDQSIRRIPLGWSPTVNAAFNWQPTVLPHQRPVDIDFNWAGTEARRIGTVLHRLLERVGLIGIESVDKQVKQDLLNRIPQLLKAMGSVGKALEASEEIVRTALMQALASETGRWILSGQHQDAKCELALTGVVDGRLVNAVIDRTFVDDDGVRWIIDYKSGYRSDGDLEAFIEEEVERYTPQLNQYRKLFEGLGEARIETALYLPRHDLLKRIGAD